MWDFILGSPSTLCSSAVPLDLLLWVNKGCTTQSRIQQNFLLVWQTGTSCFGLPRQTPTLWCDHNLICHDLPSSSLSSISHFVIASDLYDELAARGGGQRCHLCIVGTNLPTLNHPDPSATSASLSILLTSLAQEIQHQVLPATWLLWSSKVLAGCYLSSIILVEFVVTTCQPMPPLGFYWLCNVICI